MDIAREELVAAIQSDGPEAEDIQLLCDLFNSLKKEIISSPEKKAREEVANRTEQTPVPIALELQSEAKSRLQNRFDYCKERFCKDTGIVLHYDGDISYLRKAWLLLKKGHFCAGCDGTLYCQDHLNVSSSSAGCSRSTKAAYTHFELEHNYGYAQIADKFLTALTQAIVLHNSAEVCACGYAKKIHDVAFVQTCAPEMRPGARSVEDLKVKKTKKTGSEVYTSKSTQSTINRKKTMKTDSPDASDSSQRRRYIKHPPAEWMHMFLSGHLKIGVVLDDLYGSGVTLRYAVCKIYRGDHTVFEETRYLRKKIVLGDPA